LPLKRNYKDCTMEQVVIANWKPIGRGFLHAVFDAVLPTGVIMRECALFAKGAHRWVTPPQKQYVVAGITKYKPAVVFVDRSAADKFSDAVLGAIRSAHPEALSGIAPDDRGDG
jgi:hypothetical protein